MKLNRRDFLKLSGATAVGATLVGLGYSPPAHASRQMKIHYATEITTNCAFCSGGCGIIVHVRNGEMVGLEGDPDHPVNVGSLCSKANSMVNMRVIYDREGRRIPNPQRLTHVLYRAPFSDKWEEKSWDFALQRIAERVQETRDATFEQRDETGTTVNRTFAIGHLGSAAIDNEENYLLQKLMKSLGVVNLDHHARL